MGNGGGHPERIILSDPPETQAPFTRLDPFPILKLDAEGGSNLLYLLA